MQQSIEIYVEKILQILEKCDEAFLVLQTVLIALLNRKFTKLSKSAQVPLSQTLENKEDEYSLPAPAPAPAPTAPDPIQLRAQLSAQFNEALDLYLSGKSFKDMTDEERVKVNDVQTFINGGA